MTTNGSCSHLKEITTVKHPMRRECEECVKIGSEWMHLRTCQACGATAHNCEPDARGYECESCGKPEVYGAEEMLMMSA